jgi:hypothetical protein
MIQWLGSSYYVEDDDQFEEIKRWYSQLDETRKNKYTFYQTPKIVTLHTREEEAAFKLRWINT